MKQKTASNLNRREVLKVLAASGGALTAAAFLPVKWLKPLVQSGVLPAHAQASLACVEEVYWLAGGPCGPDTCPDGFNYSVVILYSPPELKLTRVEYTICGDHVPTMVGWSENGLATFYFVWSIHDCAKTVMILEFGDCVWRWTDGIYIDEQGKLTIK